MGFVECYLTAEPIQVSRTRACTKILLLAFAWSLSGRKALFSGNMLKVPAGFFSTENSMKPRSLIFVLPLSRNI